MIVRDNKVTLIKKELEEVIIKCSAKCHIKVGIDDPLFILMQGLLTTALVKEVNKNIFGEEK